MSQDLVLSFRNVLHTATLHLCKEAMEFKSINTANWDWLRVIPLCHFLSSGCKPFSVLECTPTLEVFSARAENYGYKDLRTKLTEGYS